jgi:hypothetical protein
MVAPDQRQNRAVAVQTLSLEQLPEKAPDGYQMVGRPGGMRLKLPAQDPMFGLFVAGSLLGAVALLDGLFYLNLGVAAAGALLTIGFWYVSWPALIHRDVDITEGRVIKRWTLFGGPAVYWRTHQGVARVIVSSRRRGSMDSRDSVFIENGNGRHTIDSVSNQPEGSFRWFANWQVGPPAPRPFYRADRPLESVSPAILVVARILAERLKVTSVLEVKT